MQVPHCPDNDRLTSYLKGGLSEPEAEAIEEHLSHCETCETTIRGLDHLGDTLFSVFRQAAADWESLASDPHFRQAVEAICKLPAGENPAGDEPPRPRTLGEYELLGRLPGGGMGAIFKARHTRLNRVVALKMLPEGRREDLAANFRFDREMRAVGSLDHANIVRALDAREVDGRRLLVMEFVEGMDLAELIRRHGPLPIAEACELIRQAALGLQSAHERGLVHRDIKPSNLMLTPEGQVKVLDLGLALFKIMPPTETEMTAAGQAVGTAEYMAPEQVSDSHAVDIRADVYSLGCTLYKLLAGQAPFEGPRYRTSLAKMAAHLRDRIPPIRRKRKEVPARLAAVMRKMLARSRGQRYATPSEVAAALAPFCTPCDLPAVLRRAEQGKAAAARSTDTAELCSSAMGSTGATADAIEIGKAQSAAAAGKPIPGRRWGRPAVVATALAAAAALVFLAVLYIRTRAGVVVIEVDPADAEVSVDDTKITLSVPDVKEPFEIQLSPGEHRFQVRHAGFSTQTDSFTLSAGGRKELTVKLAKDERRLPGEPLPPVITPPDAATAKERQAAEAKRLGAPAAATRLGAAGETHNDPSLPTIVFGEWIPLFTLPDQLVGWDPLNERVRYADRTLETRNGGSLCYPLIAKDVSIRARAKKISGQNICLGLRISGQGNYLAWFNGGRSFGIGKHVAADGNKFADVAGGISPQSCDDFFDFEFSAVGDTLTLSVNGKPLVQTHDSSLAAGTVSVGGVGSGSFAEVALFLPTKESLVADYRPLAGPFADPGLMEDFFAPLLRKEPDNVELHTRRAEMRARYAHHWSAAAEDLAKAIELNPDDFTPWHERTMLLVKLQQKELLDDHLAKMLAKFQNKPVRRLTLIHSLTVVPTGKPELIEAAELLAGKLPNVPRSQFWAAIACYRAGKYEEAELLFSSAAAESPLSLTDGGDWLYQPPIFHAFHAMIKARLNDREGAKELLSKAREAFKKAMLADQGTELGDYGGSWWDRLHTEALLAEAEGTIAAAKPAPPAANSGSQGPVPQPVAGSLVGADGKWKLPPGAPPPAVAPFDAATARQHQEAWAKHLGLPVEITNSLGMKLALIPPGEFMMGSPDSDRQAQPDEKPQHRVRITRPFYLGTCEVTQAAYNKIMANQPGRGEGNSRPEGTLAAEGSATWQEAAIFCRELSRLPVESSARRVYRLPTEAEWEYACRAGTTTRRSFGDGEGQLGEYAWFAGNYGGVLLRPGGLKKPNAWGLFDMLGNSWEWVQDWYGGNYYRLSPTDDPPGPATGIDHVLRGASWGHQADCCRSAYRALGAVNNRKWGGFRVVCTVGASPPFPVTSWNESEKWCDSPAILIREDIAGTEAEGGVSQHRGPECLQ